MFLCEAGTEFIKVMCLSFFLYILLTIVWVANIHLKFNFFPESQFCHFLSRSKLNSETEKRYCFWYVMIPVGLCVCSIHSTNFPVSLNRSTCQPGWHLPHSVILLPSLFFHVTCKQQTRPFSFSSSIFLHHILYSCSSFASFLFLRKGLLPPISLFFCKIISRLGTCFGGSFTAAFIFIFSLTGSSCRFTTKKSIGNNDVDDDYAEDGDNDDQKLRDTVRSVVYRFRSSQLIFMLHFCSFFL